MALALLDDDETRTVADSALGLDDGDDETTYTIRVVSPQVVKRLRKQHTKRVPTGGQGMAETLNVEAFGEAMFDYVLVGWTGPTWKGQPVGVDDLVTTSAGPVKAKTQLDGARKAKLIELAGGNTVVDPAARDHSFRSAP